MEQQRQLSAAEVAELKKDATPNVTLNIRQVSGGHILSGRIVWSKDGDAVAVQQDECVAVTPAECSVMVRMYHEGYSF